MFLIMIPPGEARSANVGKGAFGQWVGNGGSVRQVEGCRGEGDDDFAAGWIPRFNL